MSCPPNHEPGARNLDPDAQLRLLLRWILLDALCEGVHVGGRRTGVPAHSSERRTAAPTAGARYCDVSRYSARADPYSLHGPWSAQLAPLTVHGPRSAPVPAGGPVPGPWSHSVHRRKARALGPREDRVWLGTRRSLSSCSDLSNKLYTWQNIYKSHTPITSKTAVRRITPTQVSKMRDHRLARTRPPRRPHFLAAAATKMKPRFFCGENAMPCAG